MRQKCEVCNKNTIIEAGQLHFSNPGYKKSSRLIECTNCRHARVWPKPNEKKIAAVYKGNYHYRKQSLLDFFYQSLLNRELEKDIHIITQHKTKGTVLDIGAGRGDLLAKLGDSFEKWAFDPYISMNDQDALRDKIGNHVNDFKFLNRYPANTFDLVIIRNIIEHTNEYDDLLKNINRILKNGGVVFIRTPNVDSVDYKLLKNKWWVVNMDGHIVFFSKESITKSLSKRKFIDIKVKTEKRSSLLSLFRSLDASVPIWRSLPVSIIYSLISSFLGEGGDMMVMAKK